MTAPSEALETSRAYFASAGPGYGRSGGLYAAPARLELLVGELDVEPARVDVERDRVPVADEPDRPAA